MCIIRPIDRSCKEKALKKIWKRALGCFIIVACSLSFLYGCTSKGAYRVGSLDKPWVRRGEKLIHPDRTIIRFEKPRHYKGRLTGKRKDQFYEAVTPEKLLASWGLDASNPAVIKFSKKWEPRNASSRVSKFVIELEYYSFSSRSGFQAGRKMTTRRIVIYRYMGANITNRMGIGIIGYSDHVLAHAREFNDLVASISF